MRGSHPTVDNDLVARIHAEPAPLGTAVCLAEHDDLAGVDLHAKIVVNPRTPAGPPPLTDEWVLSRLFTPVQGRPTPVRWAREAAVPLSAAGSPPAASPAAPPAPAATTG